MWVNREKLSCAKHRWALFELERLPESGGVIAMSSLIVGKGVRSNINGKCRLVKRKAMPEDVQECFNTQEASGESPQADHNMSELIRSERREIALNKETITFRTLLILLEKLHEGGIMQGSSCGKGESSATLYFLHRLFSQSGRVFPFATFRTDLAWRKLKNSKSSLLV